MNKVFCLLTGGHRYTDVILQSVYNPYTRQSLLVNRCVKCGKTFTVTINTDEIIKRDIEEFKKQHRFWVRKDGADNDR